MTLWRVSWFEYKDRKESKEESAEEESLSADAIDFAVFQNTLCKGECWWRKKLSLCNWRLLLPSPIRDGLWLWRWDEMKWKWRRMCRRGVVIRRRRNLPLTKTHLCKGLWCGTKKNSSQKLQRQLRCLHMAQLFCNWVYVEFQNSEIGKRIDSLLSAVRNPSLEGNRKFCIEPLFQTSLVLLFVSSTTQRSNTINENNDVYTIT